MSNILELKETIARIVFKSDQPIVVALKGGWGEGKTYFWRNTVLSSHKDVQVGYVSVFGADSIQNIRERVVLSALPKSSESGKSAIGKVVDAVRQNAASLIKGLGVPEPLMIQLVENWVLKPGWIVCLDDIERLSDSVGIDVLLGYINELRDERGLKVVLIYNNEGSATNRESFRRYQEKAIDRELPFSPDVPELVRLVFDGTPGVKGDSEMQKEITRRCAVLNLKNIRLLAKVRDYYGELNQVLSAEADGQFRGAILYSLILFVWAKFSNSSVPALTLDFLAGYSQLATELREDGAVQQQAENGTRSAKELLKEYGYLFTDDLDRVLLRLVRTDLLDAEGLKSEYEKYRHNTTRGLYEEKLRNVWQQYYHGTLSDTEKEFCEALVSATREYLPMIPLGQLDSSLSMLSRLDRGNDAESLLAEFVKLRGASLNKDSRAGLMEPVKYQKLSEFLQSIENEVSIDKRSIDEVLHDAIDDDFLRSRDRQRLAQFSVREFVEYFSSTDQEGLTSILRELGQMATRIANPDEDDRKIQNTIREAAAEIAGRSRLNRFRMESMGLVKRQP